MTLIEIVVTLAVVGILIFLLVPAVQHVREVSRRNTCRQHLRELAIAAHGFHGTHRTLPYENGDGFLGFGSRRKQWNPGVLSCWAQLLPYLDRADLYKQVDFMEDGYGMGEEPTTSSRNAHLLSVRVAILECPSDTVRPGGTNYRTCQGTAALHPATRRSPPGWGRTGACFSLGRNRKTATFSLIIDGLSNTVLYSEKITGDFDRMKFDPVRDTLTATVEDTAFDTPDNVAIVCRQLPAVLESPHFSFGGGSWLFCGHANTWYNHILVPNSRTPDCSEGGPRFWEAATTARSWHPGGVNVAMADASVRFVSESIDLRTWRALGTRSGREALDAW